MALPPIYTYYLYDCVLSTVKSGFIWTISSFEEANGNLHLVLAAIAMLQNKLDNVGPRFRAVDDALAALGLAPLVSLYLDRCQVDTPEPLVKKVWDLVQERREHFDKVVDFGAGDARFARYGSYDTYVGYEIDPNRCSLNNLPVHVEIVNACAFSEDNTDAALSIGNPPYVRNQDLPPGWRQQASATIERRTGVRVSGLANAWQYFFFLALASTRPDGLVALVVPFEWVSRPSSRGLRAYIEAQGWNVSVHRLHDDTFDRVLTTSSITLIDKSMSDGRWSYFREVKKGTFEPMRSPSGGRRKLLSYARARGAAIAAKRGLSPGTQEYLVLTEGGRVRCGLRVGTDVVRCVTSLRHWPSDSTLLGTESFRCEFVDKGRKCWLVRTDRTPSPRLQSYFDSVPEEGRRTSTCTNRDVWWAFSMPRVPDLLMASGFRDKPKAVVNEVKAVAVGGVCGIYGATTVQAQKIVKALRTENYEGLVVPHSNGLRKLEVNQINALLSSMTAT